ncbi:MAG: nicotinate-nucleotide adenylyltransferase [Pseudomonadota bacterium]
MICLFGGTFDPVHAGHLHAARTVCETLELARIRLLLSARPGHRDAPGASVKQRWDMLVLACADDARLVPDDTEVRRAERLGRPSYAIETLEELRARAPGEPLTWVVGSDAYRALGEWHRWRELFDLANLVVLRRPGAPLRLDGELARLTAERTVAEPPQSPAGGVYMLEAPMLAISATEVRAALAAGGAGAGNVADLLPAAVYTYIKQYHLYGVVSDA